MLDVYADGNALTKAMAPIESICRGASHGKGIGNPTDSSVLDFIDY
jgi:hypothetical protein